MTMASNVRRGKESSARMGVTSVASFSPDKNKKVSSPKGGGGAREVALARILCGSRTFYVLTWTLPHSPGLPRLLSRLHRAFLEQ